MSERVPLLLAMEAPKGSRLAIASEQSLNRFYESFETWLVEKFARRNKSSLVIEDEDGKKVDLDFPAKRKDSVKKFLERIPDDKGQEPKAALVKERLGYYEQARARYEDDWPRVIADTLVQCYLHEYSSGGPREFLSAIGRRSGIIYPHFEGRSAVKRVRPSVAILDVLVKACTPVDEPVPYPRFLDLLWERFGIVVGGRTGSEKGDAAMLLQHGITIGQSDLDTNADAFVGHLADIGLARRYPDNISYVGKYHG